MIFKTNYQEDQMLHEEDNIKGNENRGMETVDSSVRSSSFVSSNQIATFQGDRNIASSVATLLLHFFPLMI